MADTFDQASQQIDQQRLALLQAIAQYGSQGRDAYQQAISGLNSQRQGEIAGALAQANSRGAPQGLLDALSGQIGSVFDRRATDLQAGQAAAGARIADIGANADAYGTQVKDSIPALRTQYQGKLAALQQAAQQKDFANQLALKRLQLEGDRLAKSSSGSGGGLKFSSSLASAVKSRAQQLQRSDVWDRLQQNFGSNSRTEAVLRAIVGKYTNLKDALASVAQGVQGGAFWSGTGKRPTDPNAKGHAALDATVLTGILQQIYGTPSDDMLSQAHNDVLSQGSY